MLAHTHKGTYTVHMSDTQQLKERLEQERIKLVAELDKLGSRDQTKGTAWTVRMPDLDIQQSDENELADKAEELHIDSIVLDELEARYRLVCHALDKAANGSYGVCELCGTPIEYDRLEANAAARTCKTHLEQEDTLSL